MKYGYVGSAGDCVSSMETSGFSDYSVNFAISNESFNNQYVCAYGEDAVGNKAALASANDLNIDITAPTITVYNPDTNPAQSKTITAETNEGTYWMLENPSGPCGNEELIYVPYSSITYTSESDNGKRVCYKAVDTAENKDYELSDPIAGIDTTAPVITLNGDNLMNLLVGDVFADPGATATDNIDGDITINIVANSTVDTSAIGTYQITYNVSDLAGNPAETQTRTVIVSLKGFF